MKTRKILSLLTALVLIVTAIFSVTAFGAAAEEATFTANEDGSYTTPYGTIPKPSDSTHCFAIFVPDSSQESGYSLNSTKGSLVNGALNAARDLVKFSSGAYAGQEVVICMFKSHSAASSTAFSRANQISGKIIVDLCGLTLTANANRLIGFESNSGDILEATPGYVSEVEFRNGTISTANPLGDLFPGSSTYTGTKVSKLSFNNVTFTSSASSVTLITTRNSGTVAYGEKQGVDFDVCFTDCTFNYPTQTSVTIYSNTATDNGLIDCDVTISGGTMKLKNASVLNLMSSTSALDSVKFAAKADGSRTAFTLTDKTAPTESFATDAGDMKLACNGYSNLNSYTLSNVYTKYGTAPLANKNNAFLAFCEGKFAYGADTLNAAFNDARNSMKRSSGALEGKELDILMTKVPSSLGNAFVRLAMISGTVNLDLNNLSLQSGNPRLFGFEFGADDIINSPPDYSTSITVSNGTLIFKNPIVEVYGKSATFEGTKSLSVDFENVTFKSYDASTAATIVNVKDSYADGQRADFDVSFENCTFDYASQAALTLVADSTANGVVDVDANVVSGSIKIKNEDTFTVLNSSDSADSVVFTKASSDRTAFTLTDSAVPTKSYYTDEGVMKLAAKNYDNPNSYTLTKVTTEYGNVPLSNANNAFWIFLDGKFAYGYNTYYDAIDKIRARMDAVSGNYKGTSESVTLYMSGDYESVDENYGNLARIDGTLTIDLGGNVFTQAKGPLFNCITKAAESSGEYLVPETKVIIKNGTVYSSENPIVRIEGAAGDGIFGAIGNKKFTFEFDNVSFDKLPGAASWASIISSSSFLDTTGTKTVALDATFTNCNIISGNGLLFDLSTSDYVDADIKICGGTLRIDEFGSYAIIKPSDSDDKITFVKNGDNYMTLITSKLADAPTHRFNNGTLEFTKVSESDVHAFFKLTVSTDLNSYVPKLSITLDSTLTLNIYVPYDLTQGFVLNGMTYNDLSAISDKLTEVDGKSYYRMPVELSAQNGADDVILVVTVKHNGELINGTFSFSITKYAKKIISTGTDLEKRVVRDVLSYIKAAYNYFGVNDAAAIALIESLIGKQYDVTSPVTVEGSTEAPTEALSEVTFVLDSTPKIRFYPKLEDGISASDYTFKIGGKDVEGKIGTYDGKTVIDVSIYAYAMCESVTYFVKGVECGSYHIASYHDFAKNEYNEENQEALISVVERFWKYCQSARDYKNAVVVTLNYVDNSGNTVADSRTVRVAKGEKFTLLSPAVAGYYTRDIYLTAASDIDKAIDVVYKPIPSNLDEAIVSEKISDIVAWGDSITNGAQMNELTIANQYGIDLVALGSTVNGGNYETVLKNLIASRIYSGIDIANMGVGGESSATIAARADTENYYLYLTKSVTLSGTTAVLPINHYATGGRLGFLRKDVNSATEHVRITGKDANGNTVTVTGKIVCSTTNGVPDSLKYNCEYENLVYTFTRTDGKTDEVTFAEGARVSTEASIIYDGRTCIIFMGTNGGYTGNDELVTQAYEMYVAAGKPKYYLVVTTHTGTTATRADLYDKMSAKFGRNYINMGSELNARAAYELAGFPESTIVSIEDNIVEGSLTSLLIKDTCHPNAVGYAVIGNIFFERLFELGAFNDILDYYDSFYS